MTAVRLADVSLGPGVDVEGIKAQTIRAIVVASGVFTSFGYDCWVTSCVRPDDKDSLHCYGMAADFDSSVDVPEEHFLLMQDAIQLELGKKYDVVYHKGHVHVEFDSTGRDIELYVNRV